MLLLLQLLRWWLVGHVWLDVITVRVVCRVGGWLRGAQCDALASITCAKQRTDKLSGSRTAWQSTAETYR